tara:strand:- start:599 stop:820 length:222 start_codon:yes stop_codon:yes gene_type:complete
MTFEVVNNRIIIKGRGGKNNKTRSLSNNELLSLFSIAPSKQTIFTRIKSIMKGKFTRRKPRSKRKKGKQTKRK